ncbi:MAG: four helix bundle protein [Clostridia bacterium]|nr:four helix bundle protein [Clostridia bacterium]MBR5427595.1 four helix bundle protein [Clostridia bacterium]
MQSYKDLDVWKKSMLLVKEVYILLNRLPKSENYGLSDQMRRSSVSIPSNIAEGYGRHSANDYIRFLNIARGSKCELETQIEICMMLGFLSDQESEVALGLCVDVGKMLNNLINRLKKD